MKNNRNLYKIKYDQLKIKLNSIGKEPLNEIVIEKMQEEWIKKAQNLLK